MNRKIFFIIISWMSFLTIYAQENKVLDKKEKSLQKKINKTIEEGISAYNTAHYEDAEKKFRKALAIEPQNPVAAYNLGLTMTQTERNLEGERFFQKAGKNAMDKKIKDKAFFNAGNIWLNKKKYQKAIEAYKDALRNNPSDEEARYNLALAMKMLKKQQKNNKNKKNKNNKNKKQNKNNKDKKKNQDKKQNQKKKNQQNKKKDQKNQNQNKNQDKKKQKQKQQPKQGKNQQKKQQPKQGKPKSKLTPEQVKQLLVGLKNKEKKTQKKIAVKKLKGKGQKKKTDKDW